MVYISVYTFYPFSYLLRLITYVETGGYTLGSYPLYRLTIFTPTIFYSNSYVAEYTPASSTFIQLNPPSMKGTIGNTAGTITLDEFNIL